MHGISSVAALVAAGPDASGFYTWLTGAPVRVILAVVALGVIIRANKGQLGKAVITAMCVMLGLFIMFGDAPMKGMAEWTAGWFGGGSASSSNTGPAK